MGRPRTPEHKVIERFQQQYAITPEGCWQWTGGYLPTGYGRFFPHHQEEVKAHRFAYVLFKGTIPSGLVIDHLCRNRGCVNPFHLEAVTQYVNIHRGEGNVAKTHCPQGHPYNRFNTYLWQRQRLCRTCRDAASLTLSGIRKQHRLANGEPPWVHPRLRTHCSKGLPFDEVNTYTYMWKGKPKRACHSCKTLSHKK